MKKKNIFEQVEEMESRKNPENSGKFVVGLISLVLIVVIAAISYFFISRAGNTEEDAAHRDQMNNIAHVRVAKEKVQKILVDPKSAEFKDVHVYKNGNSGKIVCGYVNAKNRFGGFTGYEEFIVIGGNAAIKSQGDPDFNLIWNSECLNRYLVY